MSETTANGETPGDAYTDNPYLDGAYPDWFKGKRRQRSLIVNPLVPTIMVGRRLVLAPRRTPWPY